MQKDVSVCIDDGVRYCEEAPFHPPRRYPEFSAQENCPINEENRVYAHVRACIKNLGLDEAHAETPTWNPFGAFIKPGDRVLIKPNLVLHFNAGGGDYEAVVSHASVIRPVIDYVLLALQGRGELIVGDAPQANGHFDEIVEQNGLRALIDWYQGREVPVRLVDFRKNCYPDGTREGVRVDLPGDPNGYVLVDLGAKSFLAQFPHRERLYGSDFDRSFIVENQKETHKYLLSGSVLKANVIISIPKLKTHRKTGVTINCKNMVGANGDKNYLAHYRVGHGDNGGDEYPADVPWLAKLCYRWDRLARDHILVRNTKKSRSVYHLLNIPFSILQRGYRALKGKSLLMGHGDWHGNDTTWRMCLDLNQIVLYADAAGQLHDTPQRKYFSLVDGIVAGECDGPLSPTAKQVGYVACGVGGPFAVDYVCIRQMGFDPMKLKVNDRARQYPLFNFHPEDMRVSCQCSGRAVDYKTINMRFAPQENWVGYIEREE
ncbi:PF04015 domain protein [Selenomonas sp. FOBRC9]|uniref:DUF362 domain-containing protein n=1 Tax=Selenomonas sp. FOBRC9 TaxID=936573 RepID=UPI00027A5A09|nr:DUF362 domain-containing protein [Selenomonas sp. FOBRC9]EJP32575.1 PF04015 domain protein [Selenomonas sp. FOBRC9]